MAKLSIEQIKKRIESPKNRSAIDSAAYQEERLTMHCEPIQEKSRLPYQAFLDYTNWWKSLITKEKYNRIEQLTGTPLSTTNVTKDIFDQLNKFIDAQDRYIEYKFVKKDYTDDYNEFLKRIGDDTFWTQKAVDALKSRINSVIVVDLPSVQVTPKPEPYCYFVSPKDWVDIDINQYSGNTEYIIYRQPTEKLTQSTIGSKMFSIIANEGKDVEKLIAIDDDYYRVLGKLKGTDNWEVLSESAHNLGYCPVIDFWGIPIAGSCGLNKKGPISTILRKLNYLLFYQCCADYMDLYGPFPILVKYEDEENEFDEKRLDTNIGQGISRDQLSAIDNSVQVADPRTNSRSLIGAGTTMTVPQPKSKDEFNLMEHPMKFVGMDVDWMDYVDKKVKSLTNELIQLCTGENKEYLNEIAKNKEMQNATYERKETILMSIKRQFERAHKFVTICRTDLRYGKGYCTNVVIDYGSDYFLKDSTTLTTEFESSVKAGMSQSYSNEISQSAINTRSKNNPDALARMRVLGDLEPYPIMTLENLKTLGIDLGDRINFIIKINFITFIKRFELENNISIVDFGSLIPYNNKITIIKQKLQDYARELNWVEPPRKDAGITNT